VQLADPSDQALVHARILNLLPYGADLGEVVIHTFVMFALCGAGAETKRAWPWQKSLAAARCAASLIRHTSIQQR